MIPFQKRSLVLVFTLVLVAACGRSDEPDASASRTAPSPELSVAEDPSASAGAGPIVVTVAADGSFSPDPISPDPGQGVSFRADGQDVVLCVDPASVFGGERFEIPNGGAVDLTVQPGAVHVAFAYVAVMGDLGAECRGARGGEGSGTTGP
ncbi:hypothetical protein [Rhodocaloribacter sp.]